MHAAIFLFLFLSQLLFAISERVAGDPFAEPYVSLDTKGHAVELGWPLSYAKCIDTESGIKTSGPWSALMHFKIVELSILYAAADVSIIVLTSIFGTSLACFLKDRLELCCSIGLLFSIMSAIALNLITQNGWIARADLGLIERVEHLLRSYSAYLTWYCTYSVCFLFIVWRRKAILHR